MNKFELNGSSFVGTATNQPLGKQKSVLANAVGTVTATFFPVRFNNQAVGTGNGVLTTFTLANPAVEAGVEVYVAGVLKTLTTDYTIVLATGVITFLVAPVNGAAITASYYGTVTKAIPMIAGQSVNIGGVCSGITSTASVTIS